MSSARIFISCGQKFDDEIRIASQISSRLRTLGFDVYVMKENQTLKGIKENIFPKLEEAEYFIFIDFKRENLMMVNERFLIFTSGISISSIFRKRRIIISRNWS